MVIFSVRFVIYVLWYVSCGVNSGKEAVVFRVADSRQPALHMYNVQNLQFAVFLFPSGLMVYLDTKKLLSHLEVV